MPYSLLEREKHMERVTPENAASGATAIPAVP